MLRTPSTKRLLLLGLASMAFWIGYHEFKTRRPDIARPELPSPEQVAPALLEGPTPSLIERDIGPGELIENEATAGDRHFYRLEAQAGHVVDAIVDQRGIDLAVTLVGPNGQDLLHMDRPIDNHGPEPIFAVTKQAGTYVLKLEALGSPGTNGRYAVHLAEIRTASERDRLQASATSVYAVANDLYNQKDYSQAAERFAEAASAWEELGDFTWQGESLVRLGQAHARQKQWKHATGYHERAEALFRKTDNARWQAIALHHIGLSYLNTWDLEPAIQSFQQALPLRREAGDHRGEALTHHSLAQAYQVQDEVQQSLDYYSQALERFARPRDRAPSIHNLGVLFLSMGRLEQARDALIEAEELSVALGDQVRQATTLNQLGELHRRKGELETALEYFQRSLVLRREQEGQRGVANSLANVGRVHQARGDLSRAFGFYQDALKVLEDVRDPWLEARVRLNLGSLLLERGEPLLARKIFEQSLAMYKEVGDPTGEAEGLLGLARADRQKGHLVTALKASEKALDIFESVRPKAIQYDLRSSFFATVQRHFEFHIDLLMELHWREPEKGLGAKALMVSERARARSFLDLLTEAGVEIRRGADPELLEYEKSLQGRLNAWERRRLKLNDDPKGAQELAAVERTIRQTLRDLEEVRGQIRARHPRYAEFNRGQAISTQAIQSEVLDDKTLLLQYRLGLKRSFLWAVTKTSIESFELPGRQNIENSSRRAYDLLTKSARREARVSTQTALCELSQQVLKPVAHLLDPNRLLIVADGALQFIPFAALPKPGAVKDCLEAEPLIVGHEITYLPSVSVLPILRRGREKQPAAEHSVAVVADPVFTANDDRVRTTLTSARRPAPGGRRSIAEIDLSTFSRLPYSRQEADSILDFVAPSERFRAVDFEANKETLTEGSLSDYRFVHLATHGILDSTNPELSGVVLSLVNRKGQTIDGFLRAHEIYNLDLSCDLIVLSACQTALGRLVRGEGLVGLTRGFLYAGAARAMVSLWNISDEGTAELMESFYRGLLVDGQNPATALRMAQVSMLRSADKSPPYYWAGFVLQGEYR